MRFTAFYIRHLVNKRSSLYKAVYVLGGALGESRAYTINSLIALLPLLRVKYLWFFGHVFGTPL